MKEYEWTYHMYTMKTYEMYVFYFLFLNFSENFEKKNVFVVYFGAG
jgi:hypothetical protein